MSHPTFLVLDDLYNSYCSAEKRRTKTEVKRLNTFFRAFMNCWEEMDPDGVCMDAGYQPDLQGCAYITHVLNFMKKSSPEFERFFQSLTAANMKKNIKLLASMGVSLDDLTELDSQATLTDLYTCTEKLTRKLVRTLKSRQTPQKRKPFTMSLLGLIGALLLVPGIATQSAEHSLMPSRTHGLTPDLTHSLFTPNLTHSLAPDLTPPLSMPSGTHSLHNLTRFPARPYYPDRIISMDVADVPVKYSEIKENHKIVDRKRQTETLIRVNKADEIQEARWDWIRDHPATYINMLRESGISDKDIQAMSLRQKPLDFKTREQYLTFQSQFRDAFFQDTELVDAVFVQQGSSVAGYSSNPRKGDRFIPNYLFGKDSDIDIKVSSEGLADVLRRHPRASELKFKEFDPDILEPESVPLVFPKLSEVTNRWSKKLKRPIQVIVFTQPDRLTIKPWDLAWSEPRDRDRK